MSVETKLNLEKGTISKLQDLIQVNLDSRDGFKEAADEIKDIALANAFQRLSKEREEQAEELQRFVELNDEQPRRQGSYAALIHRCWLNFREMFSSDNVHTCLAEVERGEEHIKAAYEGALKETAGSAMNDVLVRHYAQVKAAHDRVRDLRNQHKT